jgi:hypothetical protein
VAKPSRTFDGVIGSPSVGTGGPDQIEYDIDNLMAALDPAKTHKDGSPGGIGWENVKDEIRDHDHSGAGDTKIPAEALAFDPATKAELQSVESTLGGSISTLGDSISTLESKVGLLKWLKPGNVTLIDHVQTYTQDEENEKLALSIVVPRPGKYRLRLTFNCTYSSAVAYVRASTAYESFQFYTSSISPITEELDLTYPIPALSRIDIHLFTSTTDNDGACVLTRVQLLAVDDDDDTHEPFVIVAG